MQLQLHVCAYVKLFQANYVLYIDTIHNLIFTDAQTQKT